MRTLLVALLLAAAPGAASAGPALALRLGYDVSAGNAAAGPAGAPGEATPMSEVAKSAIPIQLDALWKFGSSFSMGAYYGFGFARPSGAIADRCTGLDASCSTWTMRTGIEAEWAFSDVAAWWAPWVGTGLGYAWAYDTVSAAGQSSRQNISGWELLNLEVGADAKVTSHLWLGPYLSLRYSQYSSLDGYGIANKAFHTWYGFGVRGTWDF